MFKFSNNKILWKQTFKTKKIRLFQMKKSANKLNRTFKKQGQTWMSCLLQWADYTVINVCSINLNKISVKENELNSKRERERVYLSLRYYTQYPRDKTEEN